MRPRLLQTLLRLIAPLLQHRLLHKIRLICSITIELVPGRELHLLGLLLRVAVNRFLQVVGFVGGCAVKGASGLVGIFVGVDGFVEGGLLRDEVGFVVGGAVEGKVDFLLWFGAVFFQGATGVTGVVLAILRVDVVVVPVEVRVLIYFGLPFYLGAV